MTLWEFAGQNAGDLVLRTGEHLVLAGISTIIACLIAIPSGILLTRKPRWSKLVLGFANVLQTIPSLALLGFLLPLPWIGGLGAKTAVTALVLYALLPIIRNTFTGISGIDPAVREAGLGMGMTDWQMLLRVELPLAAGVIFAGVRVAMVISIGIATIAAYIGAGGLGMYIFRGISMIDNTLILAGAVPAAVLAILADAVLSMVEKRFAVGARGARGRETV